MNAFQNFLNNRYMPWNWKPQQGGFSTYPQGIGEYAEGGFKIDPITGSIGIETSGPMHTRSKTPVNPPINIDTEDKTKDPTFAGVYKEWLGGMNLPQYMDKAEGIAQIGAVTKFGLDTAKQSLNNIAAGMQATGQNLLNASTRTGLGIMQLASKQQPGMQTAFNFSPLAGSYFNYL